MRNRENIVPMLVAVVAEVVAAIVLAPRLGLLGVGLAVSLMQIVLCTLLARRLGLQRELLGRIPGWLGGLVLAAGAALAGSRFPGGSWSRLAAISALVLLGWLAGNLVFAATRGDWMILRARVGQAFTRLRLRFAQAPR